MYLEVVIGLEEEVLWALESFLLMSENLERSCIVHHCCRWKESKSSNIVVAQQVQYHRIFNGGEENTFNSCHTVLCFKAHLVES